MLHHISFAVCDLEKASRLYDAALAPLGYSRVWTFPDAVGYGEEGGGDKLALKTRAEVTPPGSGFHLAFTAKTRAQVDAFHAAAIKEGAQDNGAPGLRTHYGPHYYAAFVIDLDGYRIEAVINEEES